jgi:hypothetical protein
MLERLCPGIPSRSRGFNSESCASLVNAEQPSGFIAALRIAKELQADLLAVWRLFQNDLEPAKLMSVQAVPNVVVRLSN